MTDEKQNEVSESKEIPHKINSISDLSKILQTPGEPEKGHTRFFRGHADKDWEIVPGIYRKDRPYLIENEYRMIKDVIINCPNDFPPNSTLFERLVRLQHYKYRTRLIDITTNALVALYFATLPYINLENEKEESKDGELIILSIPDKEIKYGDSDKVSILSAIALQQKPIFWEEILSEISQGKNINKISSNDMIRKKVQKFIKNKIINSKKEEENIFNKIRSLIEKDKLSYENDFIPIINEHKQMISLVHDIRTDKPGFRNAVDPMDLEKVLCVRAKLDNPRIFRQHGCFLLFGINNIKNNKPNNDQELRFAQIPSEWIIKTSCGEKFIIPHNSKNNIQDELESFGISKRTLFPELEAQATEIMEQYNPDSKKP